jgi:hypothetical protein
MKLLTKETYERNLRELMNTPIGGLPQKPIEKQPKSQSIVINQQPVETPTTPTSVNPQPQIHIIKEPSSLSLQKTGTGQISLTRLGVLVGVGGAMFGYVYTTSPTIQLETNTLLSKLSTFTSNPIVVGSIILGVLICSLGLVFKK